MTAAIAGSAACASIRANTSRITVASASANDIDGKLPITGPMRSGGASANGSCTKPASWTRLLNDSGAATTTS